MPTTRASVKHDLLASAEIVRLLYTKLLEPTNGSLQARLSVWFDQFQRIHGTIERKRSINRRPLASTYRIDPAELRLPELIFAIETFFAFWLKLQAWAALSTVLGQTDPATDEQSAHVDGARPWLTSVSSGDYFARHGILNFGSGDLFDWLPDSLSEAEVVRLQQIAQHAVHTRPPSKDMTSSDTLGPLYQSLIPKQARHALGAYNTPQWLADYVMGQLCDEDKHPISGLRVLDPTCGSGAFLIAAMRKYIDTATRSGLSPTAILNTLLADYVGFDIDPISVLAAKTNVLFLISTLIARGATMKPGITLPIFACDSVRIPEPDQTLCNQNTFRLILGDDSFYLPQTLSSRQTWKAFVHDMRQIACGSPPTNGSRWDHPALRPALCKFQEYQQLGLLHFYAALWLDALEPLLQPRFDLVVGNPPWVNWEYLPPAYRATIQHLWPRLGLFSLTGRQKAFSKEDISVLVAYVACDHYLADKGRLAFLMPQSVFKSTLNAAGFRRFRIGHSGPYLGVLAVDDLVQLRPFEGVANRTSIIFIQKGSKTTFPVPYRTWSPRGKSTPPSPDAWSWPEAANQVNIQHQVAEPTDPSHPESPWITGSPEKLRLFSRLRGKCPYRARTGLFTGGANAVYYLELIEERGDGLLRVRNVTDRARRQVHQIEATLEPTFVYPLLRGRDVSEWQYQTSLFVLCPHTQETRMQAVDPLTLQQQAPLTMAYFHLHRDPLKSRKGFVGWERQYFEHAFYACQRVGTYTFAPYKVVWRYISRQFTCCVVEPGKRAGIEVPVIPHEKLMLIPFTRSPDAYYLCGILTSKPVKAYIESRMVETQIAPQVIADLALPLFDEANDLHMEIAETCRQGHNALKRGSPTSFSRCKDQVDALAAALFRFSPTPIT